MLLLLLLLLMMMMMTVMTTVKMMLVPALTSLCRRKADLSLIVTVRVRSNH